MSQPTWKPPTVLPSLWTEIDRAMDGAMYQSAHGLRVIASAMTYSDGRRWIHVSVSRASSLPSWEDLGEVKDLFVGVDREALQKFPPKDQYVNDMPHCLHLWACDDGPVTPDFRIAGTI